MTLDEHLQRLRREKNQVQARLQEARTQWESLRDGFQADIDAITAEINEIQAYLDFKSSPTAP